MPPAVPADRRRVSAAICGVLALHVALVLVWLQARTGADHRASNAAPQSPLIVQLLGRRPQLRDAGTATAPAAPSAARPSRAALRAPVASITPPRATADLDTPAAAAPAVTAAPAAPPASSPPQAPLDLRLRAGATAAARTPPAVALDDPRSNTPRATLESRIAAAVGPGEWVEERIADGRMRMRRGSQCTELQRPRAADLQPWNRSVSPLPAGATAC